LLATANLNFIVAARSNAQFRQAIIHSQLNLADGMPIVWVAKLLRVPLRVRVAGSSLFERLQQASSETALNVFFFGAPDGVAEQACHRVNASRGGVLRRLRIPGFGTVESMSSDDQIRRINEAKPDFLVVALGAEKGLAWIERNFAKLEAPVVSHLGAVVGMAAGHIRRAPALAALGAGVAVADQGGAVPVAALLERCQGVFPAAGGQCPAALVASGVRRRVGPEQRCSCNGADPGGLPSPAEPGVGR
jgi:exopolysaccharide biosynthesis WecB/TagA/CpsF family protein